MRKIIVSILVVFLWMTINPAIIVAEKNEIISINVCLLNDSRAPANWETIMGSIQDTYYSYLEIAGIRLKVSALASWNETFDLDDYEEAERYAKEMCSESDIFLFFTNRKRLVYLPRKFMLVRSASPIRGVASGLRKLAFVYEFDEQGKLGSDVNESGTLCRTLTLKHEIGHILGLPDVEDNRSFMHGHCFGNKGMWLKEDIHKMRFTALKKINRP